MFASLERSRSSAQFRWAPVYGTLLTAVLLSVLVQPLLPAKLVPPAEAAVRATVTVAIMFAVPLLVGTLITRLLRADLPVDRWTLLLPVAGVGSCFALLIQTAWDGAVWSLPVGAALALALARIFGRLQHLFRQDEPGEAVAAHSGAMFAGFTGAPGSPWKREALAAAASFQLAAVAMLVEASAIGALLTAAGCFLISWAGRRSFFADSAHRMRRSYAAIPVFLTLAVLFGIGIFGEPPLYPGMPSRAGRGMGAEQGRQSAAKASSDLHSGVILRSEIERATVLVFPRSLSSQGAGFSMTENPLSFPFTGEYWFVHRFLRKPAEDFFIRRGSPLSWIFTREDRRAIIMLARQPLSVPVPMDCCTSIDLLVSSADPDAESVSLELILLGEASNGAPPRLSLGTQDLNLNSPAASGDIRQGRLSFPMPSESAFGEVHEIHIQFHLYGQRRHLSSKTAVDSFVLMP